MPGSTGSMGVPQGMGSSECHRRSLGYYVPHMIVRSLRQSRKGPLCLAVFHMLCEVTGGEPSRASA